MTSSSEIDKLLAEIDQATSEISRIRDSMRFSRIAAHGDEDIVLADALGYWEDRKRDAEKRLRLASR